MKHLLTAVVFAASLHSAFAVSPAPEAGTRTLPIAGNGFAASSVNAISGLQSTLFTDGRQQFAAFYAADGTLVLARRTLGSDVWETRPTQFKGNVSDAHNTVALAVDGAGFLHVAWDHHANPLHYAKSTAPHSLVLEQPRSMTGLLEEKVTYPAFLRLPDGGLLFFYRNGVSGQGDYVLNRYSTASGAWTQVHAKLLDGEGQRSAYPSFYLDPKGVLHAAWVWRETPDVSTNHDIAYARSADGGATWTDSAGRALTIPITAANAEYAAKIPQQRSLMNPPAITAFSDGKPVIADYWTPEGSDIPQYHIVRHNGTSWVVSQVTERKQAFNLAGTSTKRPPISRSVLFAQKSWRTAPAKVYLVFRDDERDGRAVAAVCGDIDAAKPEWSLRDLTADSLGAWEPSFDPEQWARFGHVHMLVQNVQQRDGNDRAGAQAVPTLVSSLIWIPQRMPALPTDGAHRKELPFPAAGVLDREIHPADIPPLLEKVVEWQFAAPYKRDPRGWEIAPFYIGALEVSKLSPAAGIEEELIKRFDKMEWKPAPHDYFADDYCVVQAYVELYRRKHDERMLAPSKALFDRILAKPPTTPLDWGKKGSQDRWSWCDALFMGPASWLEVYGATNDRRYLDYMNREWWVTTETLYVPGDRLFARDESFLDLREANGRRLYWSRGNGWVAAGLPRVIDRLPKDHPDLPRYVQLYREMMETVLATQQPDGLWRPGLLDPQAYPVRETSGSSFYTFALAWGVNRGLLDANRVTPVVRRAWNSLVLSVTPEGKLQDVQPVGAAPEGFDPTHTDAFGVGAFLLAGCEVYRLKGGK
jgi:rhamnogalacturonyl hydrolase YesR